MGVRAYERRGERPRARAAEPARAQSAGLALLLFLLLVANGRPIPSGDTRPTERVAASLVSAGDLDLDEFADVEFPFARQAGAHKVSTYPVLPAVLAAPVFALGRLLFAFDETGLALLGKWAAALLSALAGAALFVAATRRAGPAYGLGTALVFALGTSVWSTSQALWQHPAAVLFLSLALLQMHRATDDPRSAGPAGLWLALAVASRHADVFVTAVLALALVLRFPRRMPWMLLWGLPAVALQLAYQAWAFGSPWKHGFTGSLTRFSEAWGLGQAGLLFSPAKGLLWFTPVALVTLVGLYQALRQRERWLPVACALGFLVHLVAMGRWSEWHGGWSYGPRLMTDALPLLFLFLPDGLAVTGLLGRLLAVASVAVQALGAFCYDNRWERLYQREPQSATAALWDLQKSPILFLARERAVRLVLPAVADGRAVLRERVVVPYGSAGSRVRFSADGLRVSGSDATLADLRLERGARVEGGALRLGGRWEGLAFHLPARARLLPLELRLVGRGRGTLYVGESSFWSPRPRWKEYAMSGAFRLAHRYEYATSGGDDLFVTVGRGDGEARLELLAFVPPGEPDEALEVP